MQMKFTVGGRAASADQLGDALMKAMVDQVSAQLRERLGAIRHPITGEFPTVVVNGDTLESLSFNVEGSPELLALVKARLGGEELKRMNLVPTSNGAPPRAFLSFAWEDRELAGSLARALMENGIDTWWAEWEIRAGDSLRQKIDTGLAGCTHFLVLLTPASVGKPWVNQEMDAGLVLKLSSEARFIAVRSNLPAGDLPPLLKGMLSPSIDDFDAGVHGLINDIHEVSRKPFMGLPPAPASVPTAAGFSKAATMVAGLFVRRSATALFGDPQLEVAQITEATGLPPEDVRDALYELSALFDASFDRVIAKDELFVEFDSHFHPWNPREDALRLAADLVNDDDFPSSPAAIAELYGWAPRRLNPAIAYLTNRGIIRDRRAIGMGGWATASVLKNADAARRFVKSRS